jgi:hypothetical protein
MANQINLNLLWADLGGKTDPTDTKWEDGWVAEIPTYQNFNYVLHATESNLLHLAENGAFQWQTEINYEKGTFVRDGGFEWFCITANTGNKPSDDTTNSYWTNGKIVGRTPVTPYTQKHGLYVANVNDRTLTTWSGNDVTLENDTTLVAFNTTGTSTDNLIFGNVGGELVVVDVGSAVVPDGRTLALSNNKVHRLYHEGHPPNQTEVAGTVPEAPTDGKLYSRKNQNWVKASSTEVQTQPPPPNSGAGGGWYNLDDGQLYLDVDDGDSSQWVPASPTIIPSNRDPNALNDIVQDATPELGGELNAGAHTIGFTQQSETGTGTTTIDWKLGNKHKLTLGAFDETLTFTPPSNPCNILMIIVQDSVGGRNLTFPSSVKWLGPVTQWTKGGANKGVLAAFYFDGTNYWGQGTPWEI